jgi:hypothetical protein
MNKNKSIIFKNLSLEQFSPQCKHRMILHFVSSKKSSEAVFLVMCDPSMNDLWAT